MKFKSRKLLLMVVLSHFLGANLAFAQNLASVTCREVMGVKGPQLDYEEAKQLPFFEKLTGAIPRVPEVMWKKYWVSLESLEIKKNLLLNQEGITQMFSIPGEGEFITRTTVIENYIFLDLIHIRARDTENNGIKIGQRSKNVNFLLVKTMTGYLQAATSLLVNHPEIDRVILKGVNLKNPMLMEFLSENDFKLKRRGSAKDYEKEILLKE